MTDDDWTPYGLEAFRQGRLRRRRLAILALALVVAVAYIGLLQFGISSQSSVSLETIGGGSTVELENPKPERPQPDATLTLSPGRLNVPDSAIQASDQGSDAPSPGGDRPGAEPIYWPGFLIRWGIPLGLLLVGYLVGRGRDEAEEVNYGVYKGALPMETISARYSHLVQTSRATYQDPFGKRRPDYVPDAGQAEAGSETSTSPDDS